MSSNSSDSTMPVWAVLLFISRAFVVTSIQPIKISLVFSHPEQLISWCCLGVAALIAVLASRFSKRWLYIVGGIAYLFCVVVASAFSSRVTAGFAVLLAFFSFRAAAAIKKQKA